MIDLALLRTPEGIELVKASEIRRGNKTDRVDAVASLIEKRTKVRYELDQLNKQLNALTREGAKYFKSKEVMEGKEELLKRISKTKEEQAACASKLSALEAETNSLSGGIGNLLDSNVVTSDNEDKNPVIFLQDLKRKEFSPVVFLPFDKVLERLGATDTERGAKISGHRGYFLKDSGLILAQSLIRYGMDFLRKREYCLIQTPYMMNKEVMKKTAQLSDFDDQLYKIEGANEAYLIATSEQPISALHSDEWLRDAELPIKYGGYSTCFRKEAGAHGKDNRGIFRVHQFEKIEQFIITAPEESPSEFLAMVERSKDFYDSLELGFRVVSIVSGALNDAAAIKYDLEAFFPATQRYRELVSCSNCTDYQSRDLNIRFGFVDGNESSKKYVHMLNGTLCAVQRTLCCLLENYQTEGGVMVPSVLVPYVGEDFLPYINV
ncbi:seryl-tRNA synthetase [Nematocida displodere]|uniref:serine--tRNA ligase n=1 Tax=Nematocida displodere TaxID=1805483 RepID=A0A177EAC5_9MICR|nr:seryl-tRNA synthetase [Nematocida displodere]